ncbi:MAG: TfoX/Sxy family protein [Eubacterium sp.]|nr:TfoX/Sxy family protein [Eubacterium sp.]MBR7060389.1 TfoX/Sxy family protein [Eubacterium sp.]
MASAKEYLEFVLEQLSDLDGISYRSMMGEYIIYYDGKVVGGIYDDRFLVKQTKSALEILPEAPLETPYEGAKEMLLPDIDNRELLNELIPKIAEDLPLPKKKRAVSLE